MISLLLGFAACAILVAGDTTGDVEAESCFLYHVYDGLSPKYSLKENQENYLTINHIYNTSTITRVTDGNGTCIVGVRYKPRTLDKTNCQINFVTAEEFSTLVFRVLRHKVTVYLRDNTEQEGTLEMRSQSIRVETDSGVNVAFDCPGNCYQFKKAIIRKHYPVTTNTRDPLVIYGRVEDARAPFNSSVRVKVKETTKSKGWRSISEERFFLLQAEQAREGEWFPYEFDASFTSRNLRNPIYYMHFAVTDLARNKSAILPFDTPVRDDSLDLYLNFYQTSNVRWAVICRPRPQRSLLVSLKEKDSLTVLMVCITVVALLLLIGQWVYMYWQQRQLKTVIVPVPDPTKPLPATPACPLPNAAAPMKNSMSETADYKDDLGSHEYEYIDVKALQVQLEMERSTSSIKTSRNEYSQEEGEEETSKKRISHTSINSLYGCVLNNN